LKPFSGALHRFFIQPDVVLSSPFQGIVMAAACVHTRGSIRVETLDSVLAPIHDRWVERITRVLAPVMEARADFWERWGVVRFLGDQFESWFRFECALAESLAGVLEPNAAAALASARERLEETHGRLMAAGRQLDTAGLFAALSRRLLEQAQRWCAALEFATVRLTLADLSEAGRELLHHIESVARHER
jgi:hypothetical protein